MSGLEIVTADSGTQNTDIIYVYAECPAGKQVLGGGFSTAEITLVLPSPKMDRWNSTQWIAHLAQNDRVACLVVCTGVCHLRDVAP